MIIPDLNLLIYSYDALSPFHGKAAAWWEECLSGPESGGLPEMVLFGVIRITTNPRIFQNPMAAKEAIAVARSWLQQPCAQFLDTDFEPFEGAIQLIDAIGAAGNLVTDAQIAALGIKHNATACATDMDLSRFPGLRWLNPLSGGSQRPIRNP